MARLVLASGIALLALTLSCDCGGMPPEDDSGVADAGAQEDGGVDDAGTPVEDAGAPEDAGVVDAGPPAVCGDGVCERTESTASCPDECTVVEMGLGKSHGCAARSDGSVWCWGGGSAIASVAPVICRRQARRR